MKTQMISRVAFAAMVVMLVLAVLPVNPAHAAIAVGDAWSLWYAGTGSALTAPYSIASPAGLNRLLVVGISSTTSALSTQTVSVTYGGQNLTVAVGDAMTSARAHTYLFYLKEAGIALAGGTTLTVNISGGTIRYDYVYAAVYTGVDQVTTIRDTKNFNIGVNPLNAVGPFASPLAVSANDRAVEIINLDQATSTTPATMSIWATGWSPTQGPDSYSDVANTQAYSSYIASDSTAGSTTSGHAASAAVYNSMSGMSFIAATTTVGDGNSPANKTVKASANNQAVSAFTLSASGTDTITDLVVTGTNTANVRPGGVALWMDDGLVPNEWDAGDHIVFGGISTFSGNTATFTGLSIGLTTTPIQYILTYDISATPTNGQTLRGYVSSVTGNNIVFNNDNFDATLTIDTAAPFVNSVNVQGPLEVDVTFSQAMGSGVLNPLNYTLSGSGQGTLANHPDSVALAIGNTYRLVWISGEMFNGGDIIITVDTAVQDLAGNGLVPPVSGQDLGHAIGYAPLVSMTSPTTPAPSTNISPIPVTVTFVDSHTSLDEDVTGFTSGDIVPTNATISNFAGSGAIYTFDLTPVGQGLVSADIPAGVAQDLAGNLNLEAATFSRVYDNIPPAISIGAPNQSITNTGPVDFPITVTGANTINLLATNVLLHATGTAAGSITVLNGTSATPTVRISSITGDGQLDISIVADIASDSAGNTSLPAGPSTPFTVDNTRPVVTIGSPSVSVTRNGPVTFQVTVSGAYSVNLLAGNITLNHTGTAAGSVSVVPFTGTTSTPIVLVSNITGDGTLGISIAAGIAVDAAGNTSLAAGPSATFGVDNTRPVVSIGSPNPAYTNTADVIFPLTVSGADTINLLDGDITVLHLTGTTTGTASVVPGTGTTTTPQVKITGITGNGTLGISLAEGFAMDTAGNKNPITNSPTPVIVIADFTPPETTITAKPPLLDNNTTPTFSFSGSDAGSGIGAFMCSLDAGPYAACTSPFALPALADGLHTFAVFAIDRVGNADPTPASYAWQLDSLAPNIVSITRAGPNPTGAASVDFTVIFSEDVTGVNPGDFVLTTTGSITGASVTGVMYGPRIYLVTVDTGSGYGTLRLDVSDTATIASLSLHALAGLPYTAGEAYDKLAIIFLPLLLK